MPQNNNCDQCTELAYCFISYHSNLDALTDVDKLFFKVKV